jgi:hypothetical protein
MRIGDRYQLAAELAGRYWKGSRQERGAMLDAFCLATGYHRKYAIAVLGGRRRVAVRCRRTRARRYGPEFQRALLVAWEASGYVCSERLQPFLPELVPLLEQHQHLSVDEATRELLLQASVSAVERALAPKRKSLVGRRMAQTKPGTLLRRQIPALVGPWKAEDVPGYLEIDLVSHSGEYAAGTFLYTLSTVDLATGWTERIALLGKGQQGWSPVSTASASSCPSASVASIPTPAASSSTSTSSTTARSGASSSPVPGPTTRTTTATSSRRTGRWCAA